MATVYERPKRVKIQDQEGTYNCNVVGRLYGPPVVIKKTKPSRPRPRSGRPRSAYRPRIHQSEATLAFVCTVRKTFSHKREVYEEFKLIMVELQKPGADYVALIKRVILLFNGYPELILTFSAFLPSGYDIELQEDAIVIKVYDYIESDPDEVTVQGTGQVTGQMVTIDPSVEYLQGVKKAIAVVRPQMYQRFLIVLESLHSGSLPPLEAIRDIVKLFKGHPNLVLGFNPFLPQGYNIHMYDTKNYTVEYRNEKNVATTIVFPAN